MFTNSNPQRVDAVLPITALRTFDWNKHHFVFQGQGPYFRVIDDRTGNISAQVQVFRRNNVHGFIILPGSEAGHVKVIVWGGHSLRVVELHLISENDTFLLLSSAEFLAPDWIKNGCCATEDRPDTTYFVTANNALLSVKLVKSISHNRLDIKVYQLTTSVKSILFSADLVALSASHVLVASGTVFGEIIVWSCFIDDSQTSKVEAVGSIHHFFTGHDGSIYGVRISPKISSLKGGQSGRLLASCSDDRTVRIWDISDCEYKMAKDQSPYSTDGFELHSTGFGAGFGAGTAEDSGLRSESCLAKAFGHSARIWDVHFRPVKNDSCTMGLVTRGEDCNCVLWDLKWEPSNPTKYQLHNISTFNRHSGKHIWSLALRSGDQETTVYTGGADGALRSFKINEAECSSSPQSTTLNKKHVRFKGTKDFAFFAPGYLIAGSAQGELTIGKVIPETESSVTWETLCIEDDLRSYILITGIPQKRLALIGNSKGQIRLYNQSTKSVSDLVDLGARAIGLFALESNPAHPDQIIFLASYPKDDMAALVVVSSWESSCSKVEIFNFNLPQAPCGISCASLVCNGEYLIIGSQTGGLAVYRVTGLGLSSQPLMVDRRLHGSKSVNHILAVPRGAEEIDSNSEYVLTCGRDGNFCVHELKACDRDKSISFKTIHRTTSSLGGNIEGGYFDEVTGDLMLYGFRSQDFVLRNESKQTDITTVPSGGFRRLWAFQPNTKNSKDALFVWNEVTHVKSLCIRTDLGRTLRAGGHGREIKTMDCLNSSQAMQRLFVTGAEDNTVRIFASSSQASIGPWGSFESQRVLDTHRSGIQQVKWSQDGDFLFTSAAYEEFFVWGVRSIPSFGLATVLVAASPKDDSTSELRTTSFDILEVEDIGTARGFLICLTFSNSTIKIFHFSPADGNRFTLLARGAYMTNCLTQAHFLMKGSSLHLITAATDGYFTLWDLTNALEPFYAITPSALKLKQPFGSSQTSPQIINCESRYQIHSNSIKALELVPLSETATVILAGGDDNSCSVSLLETQTGTIASVSTVSIPDAHAASVTTLKVLDQRLIRSPGTETEITKLKVASSGNDHRVKIWSITVDPSKPDIYGITVTLLLDMYSAVADISSLDSIQVLAQDKPESNELPIKLLVCGVGMEIFQLRFNNLPEL
ncbi:hypothetical protein N7495_008340 [Penicillium taxi]|uniref:uncharacterized protein n=1 Tax=Penicillium taxi TaxID=168475 RepID=UPI0025456022|nr:uncharacterized protein N7495_008340 [Penicillium taxi]KAJ5888299.1 hypothetical protein N7495_008340 [Penicillium taxi]